MEALIAPAAVFSRRWIPVVDETLATAIGEGIPDELFEAMRYATLGPGKRLRPLLAIACCEAYGGSGQSALPVAAAVEMVHAFSLVHDDLPCMDDDDMRRGRPTVHKAFGEPVALLAGDALLARAVAYLAGAAEPWAASATAELAASVADGMIPGQVLDMLFEGAGDAGDLDQLHSLKTGRLIAAACKLGAIVAGASASSVESAGTYGAHVGLAFQIADDILDAREPGGSDSLRQKSTYPGRFGLDGARQMARAEIERAIGALASLPVSPARGVLEDFARFAIERDH